MSLKAPSGGSSTDHTYPSQDEIELCCTKCRFDGVIELSSAIIMGREFRADGRTLPAKVVAQKGEVCF